MLALILFLSVRKLFCDFDFYKQEMNYIYPEAFKTVRYALYGR